MRNFLRSAADWVKRLTTYPSKEEVFWGGGLGSRTRSGTFITTDKAIQIPAFYGAIKRISEDVAQLPFGLSERQDRGSIQARNHYLYDLVHNRPNDFQTSFQFRLVMQSYCLRWGNAYAEIARNPTSGRVVGLYPIPSEHVRVEIANDRQSHRYVIRANGRDIPMDPMDIFHIRTMGNGFVGLSPVSLFREGLAINLDAETAGASFFSNMFRPSAVAKHPQTLDDEAYGRLNRYLNNIAGGKSNTGNLLILEEGMELSQWSIPPTDAQFLETRQFQTREIARMFGLPPHLIQDLENATFSNIEEQGLEYVIYTLQPWIINWEQEANFKLLTEAERARYFFRLNANGLLRGNSQQRSAFYKELFNMGALSTNDIRELEDLPSLGPAGDQHFIQLNMTTLEAMFAEQQGSEGQSGGSSAIERTSQLAQVLQRIYLAVGVVITPEEARAIVNQAGLDLDPAINPADQATPAIAAGDGEDEEQEQEDTGPDASTSSRVGPGLVLPSGLPRINPKHNGRSHDHATT